MSHQKIYFAVLFFAVLTLLSRMEAVPPPYQGDHLDILLMDGRLLNNVEVLRSDPQAVLVRSGNNLTQFRPQDIRTLNPVATVKNSASPTGPITAAKAEPPPSIVEQTTTKSDKKPPLPETNPDTPTGNTAPSIAPQGETPLKVPGETPIANGVLVLFLVLVVIGFLIYRKSTTELKAKMADMQGRYGGLIDLDKAVVEKKQQLDAAKLNTQQQQAELARVATELQVIKKQLSLYDDEQNVVACGHYRPSYDFSTSEEYKQILDVVREKQREMLKGESAAICLQKWTVNGSESEGKKATKRTLRLMLRAFNGECDAIVANVSWSNIDRMVERVDAAYTAINKLGESYSCSLSGAYLKLKHDELNLAFEYAIKLKKEKDEQKELREQMREEERARKEMEDALKEAALEEERAKKALEKAREELAKASGEKEQALNEKIRLLEGKLAESLANKERAISRAQMTKSGHVYIISNIGSFGDMVYKIGMTRRLEPYDRIQELSDASVPFAFDVHAMIYTDDAPTLEGKLHQRFDRHRINLVNDRKEFFNVTLDDIEVAVKDYGATVTLTKIAEAREFRESQARRKAATPQT